MSGEMAAHAATHLHDAEWRGAERPLPLEEALQRLMSRAHPLAVETVPLGEAHGRVLANPEVLAEVAVPPFANSAMDGFAVRSADTPGTLRVAGESVAGAEAVPEVSPGTAVRIMTGAPLPAGADAVVPLEEAHEDGGTVTVPSAPAGRHVREAGGDTAAGTVVPLPGVLGPAAVAVLASLGVGRVAVRRRPRVAILSTGDELIEPGAALRPGGVYDANTPALAAAVSETGAVPLTRHRVPDDRAAVEAALRGAAAAADLVVTSGGVSVGRYDHVRAALEDLGRLDFWRVAVQPGKPLAVGELDGTTVVGLPGNPVSALVTFELFVRPLLRGMLGLAGDGRQRLTARPDEPISKDPGRRAFLRVALRMVGDEIHAAPSGGQGSNQLRPLAAANGLLVVPEGEASADPARTYEAILTGSLA